jgi:hypothetical protein
MVKLAIPVCLAGLLAVPAAVADGLSSTLSLRGLSFQSWSLADGTPLPHQVEPSGSAVFGMLFDTRTGFGGVTDMDTVGGWRPTLAAATGVDSVAGGAISSPLGDGVLVTHLSRLDAPWNDGYTGMNSRVDLRIAPNSYATLSGHWQFEYTSDDSMPDRWGVFSVEACLHKAFTECQERQRFGGEYGGHSVSRDGSFARTVYNHGSDTMYLRWSIVSTMETAWALAPVPEPAGWGMLGAGLLLLGARRRR